MLRAAIYARFSRDTQRDESIDAQVRLCREHCDRKGYAVVAVYADAAQPGKKEDRDRFQAMLRDAKARAFDVIVVDKVDRFSRDRYFSAVTKYNLRKQGIQIEYASQKIEDNPEGRMLEGQLELLADYFLANLSRETRKGLEENALRGWHCGGRPPLGYKVKETAAERRLKGRVKIIRTYEIDEPAARVIRQIFEMYDAGKSYGEIIDATRDAMITLRGRPLSKNSLHDILRNEKYTGTMVFRRGTKNNHRQEREDIIRVPDAFPAIIPRDLWERVQRRMDDRRVNPGEKNRLMAKEVYLLAGIARCGYCGAGLIGHSAYSRTKQRYPWYECGRQKREKSCTLKRIKRDWLEESVIQHIMTAVLSTEGRRYLEQELKAYLAARQRSREDDLAALRLELRQVQREIDNFVAAIARGKATDILLDQLAARERRLKEIQAEMQAVNRPDPITWAAVSAFLDEAAAALQKREDPDQMKAMIRVLVNEVIVYDDHVKIRCIINLPETGEVRPQLVALRGNARGANHGWAAELWACYKRFPGRGVSRNPITPGH